MLILVMGMHRSGTSALAGLLHSGGVFMGKNLVGRSRNNPKGHFEDRELQEINRSILGYFGGSWRNVPEMNDKLSNEIVDRMRFLYNNYASRSIWGWKDPRMAVTFPSWRDVIKEKVVFLHILRKPDEVVASLKKRHSKFSREEALELWDKYNLAIVEWVRKWEIGCLMIKFDDLVEDAFREQKRIEKFCDIELGDGYKFVEKQHKHWNINA